MSQDVIDSPQSVKGSLKSTAYLLAAGYLATFTGQYFRYMHWPFAALLMLGGGVLLLAGIIMTVGQIKKNKLPEKRSWALLHWALFVSVAYCTLRTMYYENMMIAFVVASGIVILILYLLRKQLGKHKILTVLNIVLLGLALFLHITPRHKVYRFFVINDYEKMREKYVVIGTSPRLSFYSYLLYCDNRFDEALIYNQKAIEQSYLDVKEGDGLIPAGIIEKIKGETLKIKERNWAAYE